MYGMLSTKEIHRRVNPTRNVSLIYQGLHALKDKGYVENIRKGYWKLTEKGLAVIQDLERKNKIKSLMEALEHEFQK